MTVTLLLPARMDDCVARYSELAELGALLHATCYADHHPTAHRVVAPWLSDIDATLLGQIRAWEPVWGPYKARYMQPLTLADEMAFDEEVEEIRRLPIEGFVSFTMRAIVEGARMNDDARAADGSVGDELMARASRLSPLRGALAARLQKDPDGARAELVSILIRARRGNVMEREFTRLNGLLRDSSHTMARELRTRGFSAIAAVSPMATLASDESRITFDKQAYDVIRADHGLLLLPSEHLQPHIVLKGVPGHPAVLHYPPRNDDAVTFATVVHRFKVLQDPTRRRILRELLRQPRPTLELALGLRMAEPQVSRHLRALREAGLVDSDREGRIVRYWAQRQALERLGSDFIEALIR